MKIEIRGSASTVCAQLLELRRACWRNTLPPGPVWFGVAKYSATGAPEATTVHFDNVLEGIRKRATASHVAVAKQACEALIEFFARVRADELDSDSSTSEGPRLKLCVAGIPTMGVRCDAELAGHEVELSPHFQGLPEVCAREQFARSLAQGACSSMSTPVGIIIMTTISSIIILVLPLSV